MQLIYQYLAILLIHRLNQIRIYVCGTRRCLETAIWMNIGRLTLTDGLLMNFGILLLDGGIYTYPTYIIVSGPFWPNSILPSSECLPVIIMNPTGFHLFKGL